MKYLKQGAMILATLLLLPLHGEDAEQEVAQTNSPFKYKREKKKPSACSMVEEKMDGQYGVKMPAYFGCPCNDGFLFALDFLYLRAKNESLVYAHQNTNNVAFGGPSTFQNQINQGKKIRPDRHWKPGFRLAFGWDSYFDHWDVVSDWTYYHNKVNTSHAVPDIGITGISNPREGLFSYWFAADDTLEGNNISTSIPNKFQNLDATWQLNYNTLRLELGRSMYLTKAVSLRPHFGLQNSWIHQKMRVRYMRSLATGSGNTPDQAVDSNNKANFWGIGMCAGLDSSWQVGGGFSFLGKVAGALLSGRTNARRVDSAVTTGREFFRTGNSVDRVDQIVPGLDTALGLNWGTCLSQGSMFLSFSLAWETMFWWQQFQFLRPQFGTSSTYTNQFDEYPFTNNTLIIEGFSISGRFDF